MGSVCTVVALDADLSGHAKRRTICSGGTIICRVATVVPAEGVILKRVLEAAPDISLEGLSHEAYAKFDTAQTKTAWGRYHRRRFALVDGADVLASATQYDLAAVFEQRTVRVFGIGALLTPPAHRAGGHAMELVERLLDEAARNGAPIALLFSDISHEHQPTGFDVVSMTEAELSVTESPRRGAPMTLIRGGEERDLAAIVAMGQVRAHPFRFYLDRDVDFVQYAITKKRLLAGLGEAGARQLHFFIAEEGITAAAYVVISIVGGSTWIIEECGDRDPSGARVGAILQALIAREPVERRPTIRAWLPRGFVPPQVTVVSTKPSTDVLMVRSLGSTVEQPRLSSDDVLYWRGDIF
jgi:Acetyltransferase (GNAT) domain